MRTAICSGSFDPITLGHMDIIRRTAACFDQVYVCVSPNAEKRGQMFTPEQKLELYKKIHAALRPGGFFLEADYIACCEEEETLLRAESARRRARANIPADVFIHFDTPLTLEHELALLRAAGFSCCEAVDSIAGATFLRGRK